MRSRWRPFRLGMWVAVVFFVCVAVRAGGAPATQGAATAGSASRPVRLGAGDQVCEMVVDGWQRSYYVHVPKGYDAARPTPAVLVFHGAWMNGAMMAMFSGLNEKADAAGFIVAYPNGTGLSGSMLFFNAWAEAKEGGPPDDVKFTARMIDDLEARLNVDPKRVFVTGMSNGGMMCYRLAAELSERIAAIAPVGGTVAIETKAPRRAVPVIHFHGTEDRLVPFNGKGSVFSRFVKFKFTPIPEVIARWVKIDGCPAEAKVTELPDKVEDGTKVVEKVYGPGKDGAEVVLVEIEGGGHTWPGKKPPVDFIGRTTMDISANDMIWDFFERHAMK